MTSTPTQVKSGSELKAKPFDLCPYRYYGRLGVFRKPLCHFWEQKAAPKIQKITFNRGLHALPAVHAQAQQALQAAKGGVIGLTGPKGGLILTGIKNATPEKLQEIYNKVSSQPLRAGSSVEGQQLRVFLAGLKEVLLKLGLDPKTVDLIVAIIGDIITILVGLGPQASNLGQGMLNAAIGTSTVGDIQNNLRDYYTNWVNGQADPGTPTAAVGELIDGLQQFLVKHGFSPSENALTDAITMLANFIYAFTRAGLNDTMRLLVEKFGPLAPFIFDQLKKSGAFSTNACIRAHQEDPTKPLIEDPVLCLLWQIGQVKNVENMDQLMGYLAAMAYLVNHTSNSDELNKGLEGIARVSLLTGEFLPRLVKNGWWVRIEVGSEACSDICFFGLKYLIPYLHQLPLPQPCIPAPEENYCYSSLRIYGFVEPYLDVNDVERIWQQIERAANVLASYPPGETRNAVVQIIDGFVPAARDDLCRRVQSAYFRNTPVIVISTDGRILCWSKNTNADEAQFICLQMGIAGCHLPADLSASSSESQSPPATLVVPLPTPTDPACKWKVCLI